MAVTKREVADQLGVAKQTVVNYIDKLGLAPEHVTRVGKTDVLDDFAVSALADALGKNIPLRTSSAVLQEEPAAGVSAQDSVIAALNGRIADLKEQNDRLVSELAELRASRERELNDLRNQLDAANDRAARLADRVAGVFVPAVMAVAVISAVLWWIAGKDIAVPVINIPARCCSRIRSSDLKLIVFEIVFSSDDLKVKQPADQRDRCHAKDHDQDHQS